MIEFRLPSLGSDMDDGTLLEWHVRAGDAVRKGQVLAVVDTDKAAIDVECWHDGVVHALIAEPGDKLVVGELMAVLRAPAESADAVQRELVAVRQAAPRQALPPQRPVAAGVAASGAAALCAAPPAGAAAPTAAPAATRAKVSPAARRRARELGIDADALRGSGADGAVTLADVDAASRAPTPASRAQRMRGVIAAAMSRSKREIPHYYLSEDIPFECAAAWLAERNRGRPPVQRLLAAALLLKATVCALQRYPEFNGWWRDGAFVAGSGFHPGVAISLRDGGLVAPALHDVDAMDVAMTTRALLDLVKRTRAGELRSSELADATITVTNLGDAGVASVFGVIYPPQVALVGFGRVAPRPWVDADGVRALPALTATLAADHRASDGHRGALLLAEIRERLQDPAALDVPTRSR
jgi:pyruvate dehydrogenase E2 component (dihydrolipoamide acetyltransferase)